MDGYVIDGDLSPTRHRDREELIHNYEWMRRLAGLCSSQSMLCLAQYRVRGGLCCDWSESGHNMKYESLIRITRRDGKASGDWDE